VKEFCITVKGSTTTQVVTELQALIQELHDSVDFVEEAKTDHMVQVTSFTSISRTDGP
jgi:hypothetical protein